jgi:hypothetical protein
LREPYETLTMATVNATVHVEPTFAKNTPATTKIAFEAFLSLRASHTWLKVPDHFALMNESRSFTVQVDVASLTVGHHYAEVSFHF